MPGEITLYVAAAPGASATRPVATLFWNGMLLSARQLDANGQPERLRARVPGYALGINNTLYTELAMGVSDAPRPVASAGYNFVRWMGGALAPFVAAQLGEHFGAQVPFFAAAVAILIGIAVVLLGRKHLAVAGH